MSLYKRRDIWHTDFTVDGTRFRQSLDTTDHREAQKKEKELISQATQGGLVASSQGFAKLTFEAAGQTYLNGRRLELSQSSQKKERQLLVKPTEFFLQKRLSKITGEDVLRFREWRSERGVGPAIINMEVGVIRRMLKRAKRWQFICADIRPLKEPRSIGRALSYEEKLRLLSAAGRNDEWQRTEAAMSLALCTTMRGCEIKRLQWRDIDFLHRAILVRKSKTDAGERLIPMNDETFDLIMRIRERAKMFEGTSAEHFVFPACEHGHIDPTHSQTSFRTAWRKLTRAAGLAGLRFHDLRHHAITELAESQASDQTIMAIAGHVSQKMLARYSHVRSEARRDAVMTLSAKANRSKFKRSRNDGYVTNHVTNQDMDEMPSGEVIERNGRHEETRTPDLYRVKVAL
jgi:integrase